MKVGDPDDDATEMGPLVSASHRDKVARFVEGEPLFRGDAPDGKGFWYPATLVEARPGDRVAREEVFGPVTSLYRYSSFDDAMERANAVRFGLSAAIFTRDLRDTQRFTSEIQAGIVHVNSQTAGADVHVPFGGLKGSAWGPHEQGRAAIEFYTESVTIYQDAPLG